MKNGLTKNDLTNINEILDGKTLPNGDIQRYNANKDTLLDNVVNVDSDKEKALEELLALYKDKPEGIAQAIADPLMDSKNLNFHIKTVKLNSPHLLFECLAITKDASRQGKVRTTLAKYYVGVLKRKGGLW